jgi:hypothetical protein
MFTTDSIGLSYPASIKTLVRQGSRFNRKSPPAEEPFGAAIDSTSDDPSTGASLEPKNVL